MLLLSPAGSAQLLVVLVGIPGSGKSTFARKLMDGAPAGREWKRVSQDVLGSRGKCVSAAETALRRGAHVVIDRCNFDVSQRRHWLELDGGGGTASGGGGPADAADAADAPPSRRVCVFLPVPPGLARQRVLSRSRHEGGVDAATLGDAKCAGIVTRMQSDLRAPTAQEGFDLVLTLGGRDGTAATDAIRDEVLAQVWALAAAEVQPPAAPTAQGAVRAADELTERVDELRVDE